MKIAILTAWYPNQYCDDDGDFIRYQAEAMIRYGMDVDILFVDADRRHPLLTLIKPVINKTRYNTLREYRLETCLPGKSFIPILNRLNRLARQLMYRYLEENGKPDIIHLQHYSLGRAAIYFKKELDLPLIYTEHSTRFIEDTIPTSHSRLLSDLSSETYINIGVSAVLAEQMKLFFDPSARAAVIPNYIDTDLFSLKESTRKNGYTLVSVGSLIPRKQFSELVRIFKELLTEIDVHLELVIIGEGPERNELERQVAKYELQHVIHFAGQCSQREVAAYLKESDLFVSASHTETFGIMYVEALSCGIPIVALDSGGVRDIVGPADGCVVADVNQLGDAIKETIINIDTFEPEGLRKRCVERFSHAAVVNQYEQLYLNATKERNNPGSVNNV